MKSVRNYFIEFMIEETGTCPDDSKFEVMLAKLEDNFYKQKNELAEAKEEIERLKFKSVCHKKEITKQQAIINESDRQIDDLAKELTKFQADDILSLIDISKRLNKTLKGSGEDEMISQLMLERAKIMDHFTLAYLADTGFKPSEIKLVQGMNNRTEMFEMYFEKITTIIL